MNKTPIIIILTLVVLSFSVFAIEFPIEELGGCNSEEECKTYCDDVSHIEDCLDVAEKNGLMTEEEIAEAKMILPYLLDGTTPGGCKSEEECMSYCDDEANIIECVDFAVKIGEISPEEADMVKKTGGKGPGGCKGEEECDAFCQDEANLEACIQFALEYGFMTEEEAEMVKKIGFSGGPGGCKGEEECDAFCSSPDNQATCMKFAVEKGLIEGPEAEAITEALNNFNGDMDAYCKSSSEAAAKCMSMAVARGEMSQEEADKVLTEMQAGSLGGCAFDDRECKESFCSQDENKQSCLQHELETGRMSQEEYNNFMAQSQPYISEASPDQYQGGESTGDGSDYSGSGDNQGSSEDFGSSDSGSANSGSSGSDSGSTDSGSSGGDSGSADSGSSGGDSGSTASSSDGMTGQASREVNYPGLKEFKKFLIGN